MAESIISVTVDVLRVWLGLLFVMAGLAKLHHPHGARRFVLAIFPRVRQRVARVTIGGLSLADLLIGFALLLPYRLAVAAALALAMLLGSLLLHWLRRGDAQSGCGCFGVLDSTAKE